VVAAVGGTALATGLIVSGVAASSAASSTPSVSGGALSDGTPAVMSGAAVTSASAALAGPARAGKHNKSGASLKRGGSKKLGSASGLRAKTSQGGYDWVQDASYILSMRAAGAQVGTQIPGQTFQDVGASDIYLAHNIGDPNGYCEARGSVLWAGGYVEEGVLGLGAAPPDAGSVSGGYVNPVSSRSVKPDLSAEDNLTDREPAINVPFVAQNVAPIPHDGNGIRTSALCKDDANGKATGVVADLAGIAESIASTATASVDKATGAYTATSRAVVTGIVGAGALDTLSSVMQVTVAPDKKPVVTYRLSLVDSDAAKFNQNGFTVSGTAVPVDDLVDQFNAQAAGVSTALAAVGPLGVKLLAPETGTANHPEAALIGLPYITAPAVQLVGGAAVREGTAGQQENVHLGVITFTGDFA
jgi:hypothetical protein